MSSDGSAPEQDPFFHTRSLVEEGPASEALREAEKLVQSHPNDARSRVLLGRALHRSGDALRAVRELKQAVTLAPNDADAAARLGGALLSLGRIREALETLRSALTKEPLNIVARHNLAAALAHEGRTEEAVDALTSLLDQGSLLDARTHTSIVALLEQTLVPRGSTRARALLEIAQAQHKGSKAKLPLAGRPLTHPRGELETLGRNITTLAREEKLDRVFGRETELEQVIDILLRARKANPLLLGRAGVGKTAVAEALAWRIAKGAVPERLTSVSLIELSLAALVAGCSYRGELEARVERILREVRERRSVVLFIDEAHLLVGAGSMGGTLDVGELLKPALSRGDFSLLGATTHEEYQRTIARDPALARRFTVVSIEEPRGPALQQLLTSVARELEKHHGVTFSEASIAAASVLPTRYLADRTQPDVGVDLLDLAAVRAQRAAQHTVESTHVTAAIAALAALPTEAVRFGNSTEAPWIALHEQLRKTVLGQDAASEAIARAVALRWMGLGTTAHPGPGGGFAFVGARGSGRHTAAHALARALGQPKAHVLDLALYAEAHERSRLLGASAGYIGHEENGVLPALLRTHPGAVVLVENAERAHPEVLSVFEAMLQRGHCTDGHGSEVDARRALFLFLATTEPVRTPGFSLGKTPLRCTSTLPDSVRTLVHATIDFAPLSLEALQTIAQQHMHRAIEAFQQAGFALSVPASLHTELAQQALEQKQGAAVLPSLVQKSLLSLATQPTAKPSEKATRSRRTRA